MGKIDFIVCESFCNTWHTESVEVPDNIACQSNEIIVEWAMNNKFLDEDIFYVGVYWRDDENISKVEN